MRISSTFFLTRIAPAFLALTWGVSAGQGQIFSGNWRLNVEKSSLGRMSRPVSVVIAIDHRQLEFQYHGAVLYTDEDSRAFGFSGAFDGKPYRMSRSFGDGMITLRRVDEFTFESTFRSDDGLYTETARTSISHDGQTLTRKVTLRTPDGDSSRVEVYDKC